MVHSESDVIKESVDDKFTNLHIFESLSGDQNQACKNQIEIPPGRSHAMVTDLPETQFKTTKNVNIERLCSILDEWCTFDTYVFFKSKANKDETEKWRETSMTLYFLVFCLCFCVILNYEYVIVQSQSLKFLFHKFSTLWLIVYFVTLIYSFHSKQLQEKRETLLRRN